MVSDAGSDVPPPGAAVPDAPPPPPPAAATAPPPPPPATAPPPPPQDDDDGEEKLCRYCFDGEEEGELISPCACKGGQKWVHLDCLRRWQRMVLVSQPTHPMFHGEDQRQHDCNVCKQPYTCPPPTRHELMQSFTGVEIASLIDEGCVIGAGAEFTAELAAQLGSMPRSLRRASSYEHWSGGAYLITGVEDDDGLFALELDSEASLRRLRSMADGGLVVVLRGKRLKVTSRGSLADVAADDEDALLAAFQALTAPATVVLAEVDPRGALLPRTCGDDHVAAVNLARPLPSSFNDAPRASRARAAALAKVRSARGATWARAAERVAVVHHVGGPCDERSIVRCLVLGAGGAAGYKVVETLDEALFLAARLAARCRDPPGSKKRIRDDDTAETSTVDDEPAPPGDARLGPGQRVRLRGLTSAARLNGRLAVVLSARQGRWQVVLATTDADAGRVLAVKPENLALEPSSLFGVDSEDEEDDDESGDSDEDDAPAELDASEPVAPPPPDAAAPEPPPPGAESATRTAPPPADAEPFGGTVYAFWGDARWSRTQLLGEIARGHWGMCKASVLDVVARPRDRRAGLEDRLVFAPITAMTEESIAHARTQLRPLREQGRLAARQADDAPPSPAMPRRASDADNVAEAAEAPL